MEYLGPGLSGLGLGAGVKLLDRQVFTSSGTWTKPANGAGNVAAGEGKLVRARVVGGGGAGASNNGASPGTSGGVSSFGAHVRAGSGLGASSAGGPGRGGFGSSQSGLPGGLPNTSPAGGRGGIAGVPDSAGVGGLNGVNASGGGQGGLSMDEFPVSSLGSSVTVTVGAAGTNSADSQFNGGAGFVVVEVYGA